MPGTSNEINAEEVVAVLRRRLADEVWRASLLEAQLNELGAQLAESANDKMQIRELELRLEKQTPTPEEGTE